jgi:hypothetical protein
MCFTEDYPDGRNFKSGDSRLSHLTGYDEMLFFDDSMSRRSVPARVSPSAPHGDDGG